MSKSFAFGLVHVATSFGVGYALTGSWAVAGAITLVEPLVNTVAHYFFDRGWESRQFQRWLRHKKALLQTVSARSELVSRAGG